MAEEKQFENRIKKFLKEQGCWYIKYWGGAAYTKSGIPDLLICCNGVFVAVEVKASKGKASELQKYQIREIRRSGGAAMILYPEQFNEFKEFIEALNRSPTRQMVEKLFKGDREYDNKENTRSDDYGHHPCQPHEDRQGRYRRPARPHG